MGNSKMTRERWAQAVMAGSNDRNYRREQHFTETRDDYFVDGVQWADENPRKGLVDMADIWHKESEHPNNRHPYPVINPDTQEMAFAYYDLGWHFDRDYNPGDNMMWMDIEKILPPKEE